MPAPIRVNWCACSKTSTLMPTPRRVAATANPPMPAPTIAMEGFLWTISLFPWPDLFWTWKVYNCKNWNKQEMSETEGARRRTPIDHARQLRLPHYRSTIGSCRSHSRKSPRKDRHQYHLKYVEN